MEYYKLLEDRGLPQWPYPVEYGEETRDQADVLVIGGGMAGCFAAIHAARRGARVIVAERAPPSAAARPAAAKAMRSSSTRSYSPGDTRAAGS